MPGPPDIGDTALATQGDAADREAPPKENNTFLSPVAGFYRYSSVTRPGQSGVAEAGALPLPLCHRTPGRCRAGFYMGHLDAPPLSIL